MKRVYVCGPDWVVAESASEALQILADQYGYRSSAEYRDDGYEEPRPLDDDERLTITYDYAEDAADWLADRVVALPGGGVSCSIEAHVWAEHSGIGFLCSSEV